VLCDGAGRVADVELTPEGFTVLEDLGESFPAHSNHFVGAPHACSFSRSMTGCFPNDQFSTALTPWPN
jgi:hypothetical protein